MAVSLGKASAAPAIRRLVLAGAMVILGVGCATGGLRVTTDHDPSVNFRQFRTYQWHDGTPAKDPLTDRKIVAAVDNQLQAKGFQRVSDNADLTVTYHASTGQHVDLNTVYTNVGWGPGYGWGAYGPYGRYWYGRPWGYTGYSTATTVADTITTGSVVVDIIENKTHTLVWRGVGTDELNGNPQDLTRAINAGAAELFKNFPPPPPKS
jgi:hypothetical protein